MKLREWQPSSMLKARQSSVEKPAYPVINVHNHMGGGKNRLTTERVKHYLAEMDAAGVRMVGSKSDGMESRSIRYIRSAQTLAKCLAAERTRWRTNFYRLDYDEGKATSWDWARVGSGFHEFEKFGTLIFE